jgi:hypothetical protein
MEDLKQACAALSPEHAAQDRYLRIGVNEGNIGMPLVGASPAPTGIELKDRRRTLDGTNRRMRNQFSQPDCETFLFGVIEVLLVAKENTLVLKKHLVDRANCLVGQITRQLDVPDLST